MATEPVPLKPPVGINPEAATRTRAALLQLVVYVILLGVALAMIMPFIYSIVNSVKTLPDINDNPMLLYPTQGFNFSGYQRIINGDFSRWIFNSAFVAIRITL